MFARIFHLLPVLALALLAGCSTLPTLHEAGAQPLVHDGKARRGMTRAVVVVPGALASVGIYEPVLDWNVPDGAVMAYRFPGLDGLKLDHRLDLAEAGALIADAMRALEVKEVYLIGFSTGGPVALEAARRLGDKQVSVALISSAGPFPSGIKASIIGFFDVIEALSRAHGKSLEEAWLENYRTLLFGRNHFGKKRQANLSRNLAEHQRGSLRTPTTRLTLAHTTDLMQWTLPRDSGLAKARVGVFHGAEDSIFDLAETRRFAARIPADMMATYPGQGHLLFVTAPTLWEDVRRFFDLPPRR
ncbi:alpha/beta hydrolase [Pseudooceanicola sp.]|uniref:alpha/beta fold hydrolase n=1 Tax=Pseudooceanicola sp. TaxID=1914328 RepID=UPI00261B50F1|nr:alpha/beta hydrolase [Pseudooceanicola sp.]MDF1856144.1 alpha/beta hydrolase [Pseudooceanicola sp.]